MKLLISTITKIKTSSVSFIKNKHECIHDCKANGHTLNDHDEGNKLMWTVKGETPE